ncbi:MAG: membrane protein insertion efficiency factor YidD [Pseudomonadota bacterium]
MEKLFTLLIRGYRYFISPLLGNNCRFYPSCSCYAETAIKTHGVAAGGWLALRRICRCHPWHPGGIDLVPEKRKERRINKI